MNSFIRSILHKVFYFLDTLVPKDNKLIICGSNAQVIASGNPKYFFDYMLEYHNEYKIYFSLKKDSFSIREIPKENIIFCNSIKGLFLFIRARILVNSYNTSDFGFSFNWNHKKKIWFQTWHGTPLKKIRFSTNRLIKNKRKSNRFKLVDKKISYILSSSEVVTSSLLRSFNIAKKQVAMIGYPRNDKIYNSINNNMLENLIDKQIKYNKVILYAPTFREWTPTKYFPFDDINFTKLNEFLKKNETIILVRGHINKDVNKFHIQGFDRIIDFSEKIIQDINNILCEVDILITDYSSIFFDFLLLNRPMLFIPYDLQEYITNRGLLYDNYDYWTPGPKVKTMKKFIEELTNIYSGLDSYTNKRVELNKIFNKFQTGNTSEKMLKLIENRINL